MVFVFLSIAFSFCTGVNDDMDFSEALDVDEEDELFMPEAGAVVLET